MSTLSRSITFSPWKISLAETFFHSIPALGVLTSWGCLCMYEEKISHIDELLDDSSIELLQIDELSDDKGNFSGSELTLFEGIDGPPIEDPLFAHKCVLSAKKANYHALFILNLGCTLVAGLSFFGPKIFQDS